MKRLKIQPLLDEAWKKRREGDYQAARELVDKARKLCPDEEFDLLGRIYHIHMQFDRDHDQFEGALQWNHKSFSYYEKGGNPDKIAHSLRHMADLQRHLGQLEESKLNYLKALNIYKSQAGSSALNLANALRGFALLLEKMDLPEKAIKTWQEAKELYRASQIQTGVDEAEDKLTSLQTR